MELIRSSRDDWATVEWRCGGFAPLRFIFGQKNLASASSVWNYCEMPEELAAICREIDDALAVGRSFPWRQAMDWMLQNRDQIPSRLRVNLDACVEWEATRGVR